MVQWTSWHTFKHYFHKDISLRYLFDHFFSSLHQCILSFFQIHKREISPNLIKSHSVTLYSEFHFKKLYLCFFYPCRNSHINKASIHLFLFFPLFLFRSHMVSINISFSQQIVITHHRWTVGKCMCISTHCYCI